MNNKLEVLQLGLKDYDSALEMQKELHARAVADASQAFLMLLEHPPVITLGRNANAAHVLFAEAELNKRGFIVRHIDRGGDVTYHGPGQLVGYPIMQLTGARRDVHAYFRSLEESIIKMLATYGIEAGRIEGLTGVWVGKEKVCAMGVAIKRWTTYHGFALNVQPDLTHFRYITPCGISDKGVTSMSKILGRKLDMAEVSGRVVKELAKEFAFSEVSP